MEMMLVKSSLKRKTTSHSFEPGITRDILLRLPVEALNRFEHVCKPWQALVQNININRRRLLYATMAKPLLSIQYEALNKEVIDSAIKEVHSSNIVEPNTDVTLLGSCHALVLLEKDEILLLLWNPSTGETRVFPKPALQEKDLIFHGLGYDPSTEDYKIILGHSDPLKTVIEVFSVKRNAWRTYIDLECGKQSMQDLQGCYLNGAIHWINISFMKSSIISFSLADNRFEETLPLPDLGPDRSFELTCLGIGTAKNRLFVYSGPDCSCLSIWVMKEFGVGESWTRVVHVPSELIRQDFGRGEHGLKPVCILDSGQVMIAHDEKCLLLYDPKARTFRKIIHEDIYDSPVEVLTYEENLESLPVAEVVKLEED
ncbi:PREDICTED: F-box/kelch-repeat protein At3g23880 [Fragaria vesca subsp. vesca]|uniref:F-box/kelch-repeat protein At3g23880 n=1 Tax=Fragaria vesca subsp. vesca TaxID=101020 RepID=UPI0002C346DF|nr:PREDICTED: F-box/kelch-repeat protein At3g23880 [Fragaria vesca subsp. vesca]